MTPAGSNKIFIAGKDIVGSTGFVVRLQLSRPIHIESRGLSHREEHTAKSIETRRIDPSGQGDIGRPTEQSGNLNKVIIPIEA